MVLLPVAGDGMATLNQDWTVWVRGWVFTVPRHFRTDGASIPRALWRLCGHPLESPRVYAALVHDWLYSGRGPSGIDRGEADAIYRDLLVEVGWGRFRSFVEWVAIRWFGSSHWTAKKEK